MFSSNSNTNTTTDVQLRIKTNPEPIDSTISARSPLSPVHQNQPQPPPTSTLYPLSPINSPLPPIKTQITHNLPPIDPVTPRLVFPPRLPSSSSSQKIPTPDNKTTTLRTQKSTRVVKDMRGCREGLDMGLDLSGWTWRKWEGGVRDEVLGWGNGGEWERKECVEGVYFEEIGRLLKEMTGGKESIFVSHLVRRQDKAVPPAYRLHVDASEDFVRNPNGFAKLFPDGHVGKGLLQEAFEKGQRIRIFNVWKPLQHPIEDIPLCVVDWRTVDMKNDLKKAYVVHTGIGKTEMFYVSPNPAHQFYSISHQTPSELLIFKTYDSLTIPTNGKIAGGVPHSAFEDPEFVGKEGTKVRESVECRFLVLGDDD